MAEVGEADPPTSPALDVALPGGEAASLTGHHSDRVTLIAARAFPPGAPITARVLPLDVPLTVKVRGCRRVSPASGTPSFQVDGRLVSPTRALRALLRSTFEQN